MTILLDIYRALYVQLKNIGEYDNMIEKVNRYYYFFKIAIRMSKGKIGFKEYEHYC